MNTTAQLIAQGPQPRYRWRRTIERDHPIVLGRLAPQWNVPWDLLVSRSHARCHWDGVRLHVHRLPEATNPIFFQGEATDEFHVAPDQHFVIGDTSFQLVTQRVDLTEELPEPFQEKAYQHSVLKKTRFRDSDHRIELLGRLPDLIQNAVEEDEVLIRLTSLILAGTPMSTAAALVRLDLEQPDRFAAYPPPASVSRPSAVPNMVVEHWDGRRLKQETFTPSTRLIQRTLEIGESTLHVWNAVGANEEFTQGVDSNWAFCVPIPGKASIGWALYVSGQCSPDHLAHPTALADELQDDVKFSEIAASMLGNVRMLRRLERRHTSLGQFFSPVVLQSLADQEPDEVLAPKLTRVAVMFCDLRGFTRKTEQEAEHLMEMLHQVSHSLGIMTRAILDEGGVVGDFHGDSAMGFWGWPIQQPDAIERAARAALEIRQRFQAGRQGESAQSHAFAAGTGIATGQAVAGKIGTTDQVKVSVFGPVVNLASRLEGMTKILQAPILLDEPTARAIRQRVPRSIARVRSVARVQPYGMDQIMEVSELLPPEGPDSILTDEHLAAYERGLQAFIQGDWEDAIRQLHRVPAEDRVKDFLTVRIAQHNRTPPPGWQGVIGLSQK